MVRWSFDGAVGGWGDEYDQSGGWAGWCCSVWPWPERICARVPYALGYWIGKRLVAVAAITGKRFAIRAIRVKIFWANSVYNSAIEKNWVCAACADRGGARADRGLLRRFAPRNDVF